MLVTVAVTLAVLEIFCNTNLELLSYILPSSYYCIILHFSLFIKDMVIFWVSSDSCDTSLKGMGDIKSLLAKIPDQVGCTLE